MPDQPLGNMLAATVAPPAQEAPPSYINGQYASTPDEMAEDVRRFGTVRTDMSTPAQRQFLQNLPPDIEQLPDPAGYILLRLRNVPMS